MAMYPACELMKVSVTICTGLCRGGAVKEAGLDRGDGLRFLSGAVFCRIPTEPCLGSSSFVLEARGHRGSLRGLGDFPFCAVIGVEQKNPCL